MKVVIIGGVAGGASCATRLRRLDESAEIVILERGENVSYANCGLPYFVGGKIEREEDLTVASPAFLKRRFRIDVRVRSEAVGIDAAAKTVRVREKDGMEYEENYDKLVLAPGAAAKTFGWGGEGVFTLRDVRDATGLAGYIRTHGVKTALVAGGGFIGVETAENLLRAGLSVTLAEFAPQLLPPLDPELAVMLSDELKKAGADVRTGTGVKSIDRADGALDVAFTDGTAGKFGIAVLALGVSPETSLAKSAGAEIAADGGIAVDGLMRTSLPDVYAAGGASSNGRQVLGASVAKVCSLTAASVGLNEKQLKKAGTDYRKIYSFPFSHATYYPGATQLVCKLLFAPDGRVLGAQAVGADNVEKQIDVIAAAMKFGGTVRDLAQMELCYAPPYNSAKSPVNMMGFIASNLLDGLAPTVYAESIPKECAVLDVRTPQEFAAGHIDGSFNIPLDELRDRLSEVPQGRPLAVTCAVGLRGYLAVRILLAHGFDARNLSGGFRMYTLTKKAGLIK